MEEVISLGPWGGKLGVPWSFRASREIISIFICQDGNSIVSISFRDATGHMSGTFGGNDSSGTTANETIRINSPVEYLSSISGTEGIYNSIRVIRSLSFITNLTTYGPFGTSEGDSFSIPISNSAVVGFFGEAYSHLNSLGIYVKPVSPRGSISLGPWGGSGGDPFNFKVGSWITQITVFATPSSLKSVSFKDANGQEYGVFGGKDPNEEGVEQTVTLNGEWEYLKSIRGTYGNSETMMVVTSLSFVTNMFTYGPFGKTTGTSFSLPLEGSSVTGFHGRSGSHLNAIGIHCHAMTSPRIHGAVSIGPWGGKDGDQWRYLTSRSINEIVIYASSNIKSISFRDTSEIASATFGGRNPEDPGDRHSVRLNWSDERLVSISGTHGDYHGNWTITSLTFITNLATYGPFGATSGTSFSIPLSNCTIVGFYGRARHYLDSIGIFVKPDYTI